jgi:hypothetical protein
VQLGTGVEVLGIVLQRDQERQEQAEAGVARQRGVERHHLRHVVQQHRHLLRAGAAAASRTPPPEATTP